MSSPQSSNDDTMSMIRLLHGPDLSARLGAGGGVTIEQIREVARLCGMRWRISPSGTSRQPADVLDYVHQILGLRFYGRHANEAAGLSGDRCDITSVGVLKNLAADDIVVLIDPATEVGRSLLDGTQVLPLVGSRVAPDPSSAIAAAASKDALEVLKVLLKLKSSWA